MSLTTKTPEHVVPAYNLPKGRAVDRGKVAEAAQKTAQAEPHMLRYLRNRARLRSVMSAFGGKADMAAANALAICS